VPLAEVLDRLTMTRRAVGAGPAELLDWLGQLDQQVAQRLAESSMIPAARRPAP
jgi:hypothetical protein